MNRLIYTALLCLQLATIAGQQPAFFKFKYLQQGDGMEDLMTYCVLKDRLGILWVGGNKGIKYYDGLRLQHFELNVENISTSSKVVISSFAEDRDGRLWVGTDTGLVILSPDRSNYILPAALGILPTISKATNSHVQADETGNILFLSGSTLYRTNLAQNNVSVVANIHDFPNAPESLLNFLYTPKDRAFYFFADDSQLFMLRGNQLKNINYPLYQTGSGHHPIAG